ncbi:hypothetical protein ACFO25_17325 [Paenactinomyces guangxiensis]|uniref:Uncharacterized protein n=1 Tax=Paenactinomyces guangxiensis TaxID=1490290 RepID=A0A7W1WRT0_9BACL|nr:hypothetical protein [Paenactinomyces guangxiensis]MBA4494773.1 hypothetical protein [Paenactinomyces guangxiensis]MBH8591857.1 hypothetical protein [Paenactinomyces guangxiensis]
MRHKKPLTQGESATIRKGEAVAFVIYAMAKLGYSRIQIEELVRELRNSFGLTCRSFTFDSSLTAGRADRKSLLPTIDKEKGNRDRKG